MTHPPTVTLTTDFGTRDGYVGAVKGVVLCRCPGVHVVDITHDVPPQDVWAGAFALGTAAPWFPPGTVHVGVVDPGVGTDRNVLVAALDGQLFVGPDNGLVTAMWRRARLRAARRAVREDLYLGDVSRTFHGRDVFAPLAAALAAARVHFEDVGPPCDPVLLPWPQARASGGVIHGEVLHVDRFGNLVTNVAFEASAWPPPGVLVDVGGAAPRAVSTYAEAPAGELVAVVGSSGYVEISVVDGNAAERLGAGRGTAVRVTVPDSVEPGDDGHAASGAEGLGGDA